MTWLGDRSLKDTPDRQELLDRREQIVAQILELQSAPAPRSRAGRQGRQEDLLALAKKVTAIDKKLGRL